MSQNKQTARRHVLGTLASMSVLTLALPSRWQRPLVSAVMLPAHAQTSFSPGCSGVETEPVSEPINITVSATEILGPVVVSRTGGSFTTMVVNTVGTCSDTSVRTEEIEFSGTIDSATNSITGSFNVRQFCGGTLACEQLTTYSVTQVVPSPGDDLGDYQGRVTGTLRCCVDFL